MSVVSLEINERTYEVACEAGQEAHLRQLAQVMDERVRDLVASVGSVGEPRLLAMAGLMVADELHEAHKQIHDLESKFKAAPPNRAESQSDQTKTAATVEACTKRVEAVAARLGSLELA